MLDEDARERIGGSARRVGHNNCDRSRWIGLRPCDARHGRKRGSAGGQMQKITAGKSLRAYFSSPPRCRPPKNPPLLPPLPPAPPRPPPPTAACAMALRLPASP